MTNSYMIHKFTLLLESTIILLSISWNAFFGSISAILASLYYLGMFKVNIIDKKYGGSWEQYLKTKFNNAWQYFKTKFKR